jgi:2-C-methyl-D-erythritol 4-phosphate cytidylyltransferase
MGGRRKQFRTLGGRSLLAQTLHVFERHPGVGALVVAAPDDEVREVSNRLRAEGLTKLSAVVSGAESRQGSVRNALRAVPSTVEIVLVHDAVRPFVRGEDVGAVIDAVRAHGAASLAIPVADTLRRASGEAFSETVDRSDLYQMQTPQGFRREWLETAHRRAASNGRTATDDVELVQHLGRDVRVVEGSRQNFKLTTPSDWRLAETLWPEWSQSLANAPSAP